MGHRHHEVAISSVPNLYFLSSDHASTTNINIKLKFAILLNPDSFTTVFSTKSRCFSKFFLKNPAYHVTPVNFRVVFRTMPHNYYKTFVTTGIF